MALSVVTYLTPHITMKEAACTCCGKWHVHPMLTWAIEAVRAHVSTQLSKDVPFMIHCMSRCWFNNTMQGRWVQKGNILTREQVATISGFDQHQIMQAVINQAKGKDSTTLNTLNQDHNIHWQRLSAVDSRHLFTDMKPTLAVDAHMPGLTPGDLAEAIHDVMMPLTMPYAVFRYFKWNNPGVHFDVDSTRGKVVDLIGDRKIA